MYLVPIRTPVFVDGARLLVQTDWKRALLLLRDSLGGRYGDLHVIAPAVAVGDALADEQRLEEFAPDEGVRLEGVAGASARTLTYWREVFGPLRARMGELIARADVVHTGLDELFRPFMQLAFVQAVRRGVPTVFVQDTDVVVQELDLAGTGLRQRTSASAYARVYERVCRASVARASLSLLKGKSLMRRYAAKARDAREFQNTSYLLRDIIANDVIERRLATLNEGRPLRFVYCGRLVDRKGAERSVRILAHARELGADVTLDLIGGGPCEPALRAQVADARLVDVVRFLGPAPYDSALLTRLASYDALLFTPTAEDTPRMIFDGYAAGLPLVGAAIPYVEERAAEERATFVLPRDDDAAAAQQVAALAADRAPLREAAWRALAAGRYHAADLWYGRRAEWTHEAVDRCRVAR